MQLNKTINLPEADLEMCGQYCREQRLEEDDEKGGAISSYTQWIILILKGKCPTKRR